VRIKAQSRTLSTKENLLKICANSKIKIEKVVDIALGFLVFCSEPGDAELIFEVLQSLSACEFTPQLPPEIRANRSVIRTNKRSCHSKR